MPHTINGKDVAFWAEQAKALHDALRLYDVWAATPTDRGGKAGPKGQALTKFQAAKDAALAAVPFKKDI